MDETDLLRAMTKLLRAALPSGRAVYSEAIDRELGPHRSDVDWIKSRFSELVDRIQVAAYRIYQDAERKADFGTRERRCSTRFQSKKRVVQASCGFTYRGRRYAVPVCPKPPSSASCSSAF